jgi:hypothetical protein
MTKPFYTSTDLIEAVKRKASIPISQNTFSDDDILKFANEEMFLAQVPSILQFHEEYLVYEQDVPLLSNVSKYPIPTRAIGMKLRDVFYRARPQTPVDENDSRYDLVEMSKINPDDRAAFQVNSNSGSTPYHYYLQNNSVVVHPRVGTNPTGSLLFSYFLRPNSLVTNDRAAICQSFSKTITLSANPTGGDTITIGSLVLEAGVDFVIGGTTNVTTVNIAAAINADGTYIATNDTNITTVFYEDRRTVLSSNGNNIVIQSTITLNFDQVPSNIKNGSLVDSLQTEGGHNTLQFDIKLTNNSVSLTSIIFNESNISTNFIVGDYICSQYECIIPQVPSDLHNLLAERTCARVLESIGDQDGLKVVNIKIQEQEARQGTVLDNRVDGSPQKVFDRHSLLRSGSSRRNRGY